jgi:ABC-type Fe3+ transport system permease subunit
VLHGICNDYFLVIAAMYVARLAGAELASQAQSWLILVISGFGQAIGSAVAGLIYASAIVPRQVLGAQAWTPLWAVPVLLAALTAVTWVSLFRPVSNVR